MATLTLKNLIQNETWTDEERELLETGVLKKARYLKGRNQLLLTVLTPKSLPFGVFKRLKESFETNLGCGVKLTLEAEEEVFEPLSVQAYYRYFVQKDRLGSQFKEAELSLKGQTLTLLFPKEEMRQKAETGLTHLEEFYRSVGLTQLQVEMEVTRISTQPHEVALPKEWAVEKKPSTPSFSAPTEKGEYPKRRKSRDNYIKVQLKDIQEECTGIQFEADVFKVAYQELRTGNTIQTLSLCDADDAIICKRFTSAKLPLAKLQEIHEGDHVRVTGSITYDTFDKELTVKPNGIEVLDKIQVMDEEPEKRIELHAHSNISEMDGVCEVSEFIQKAFDWGHEAFALTDHLAVQNFPKAQRYTENLLKKNPDAHFKMIYGVEMNRVDPTLTILTGEDATPLGDEEYVAFDLETTGLSTYFDSIIEFGAARIVNATVVERKQFFIKPPVPIPPFIQQKTNITEEQVAQAKPIEEAMEDILAFFGDAVLVAHNAKFDVGFINEALRRMNRSLLKNPFVDTLDLARGIHADRRAYRLGNIARLYRITYDEEVAHRADYDANVLADVFLNMLTKAKELGAKTVNDLQNLQSENAYAKARASHICVLAKDQAGIKAIYDLVTISNTQSLAVFGKANSKSSGEEFLAEARIFKSAIDAHREHLLIGSACLNSDVFELACNGSQENLEEAMAWYDYIEVQPCENYKQLLALHSLPNTERLQTVLRRIIATAEKLKKIIVATGDAHYVLKEEKIYRDIYIQTQGIGGVRHPLYIYNTELRHSFVNPEQHFRTTKEMLDAFAWLDDPNLVREMVITNTHRIADQIQEAKAVPDALYPPSIPGSSEHLTEICYDTAHRIYGEKLPEIVEARLKRELDSIIGHGYSVIYYTSHLLVKQSNDDGYLVGSRGSVGSSFVATMSGITEVNPLAPHYVCPHCHHVEWFLKDEVASGFDLPDKKCPECGTIMKGNGQNIPFETFLGFEGDKVPDIDLNFSGEYQEKAHAFTKTVFGDDHVFRAGTIGTVADKTAYGYVTGYAEEMGIENMRRAQKDRLALGCTGVKRTTGQHPGGIIVIPLDMDVTDFTPVQYPANDPKSTWKTTHFDFHDIHDNVLKFDILGHVDPTAMRLLQNISGIDPLSIPMNDPETMSLFSSAKALKADPKQYNEKTGALGLPEFGTNFVRGILEATQPKSFSDLLIISGLSHGTGVWLDNASNLVEKGIPLQEVIGCRDDIMTYLLSKGLDPKESFTIMESVRKGKGLIDDWEKDMEAHDVDEWYIDSCKKIKYMFPKAHAVAYVIMAVRIAWFKVHHPEFYYVSYFTLRCDAYEIETMTKSIDQIHLRMEEIRKRKANPETAKQVTKKENDIYSTLEVCAEMIARGYRLAPINLYESSATAFRVDPKDNHVIIPPFITVDGLGENVANSVEEARKQGPFLSKEDLAQRTQLSTTLIRKLEVLGALEGLQEKNQMSLF